MGIYMVGSTIGYFIFLIIAVILGIVFAKSPAGWIIYGIVSALYLFAMISYQNNANIIGMKTTGGWTIYILLLVIGAIGIIIRRANSK